MREQIRGGERDVLVASSGMALVGTLGVPSNPAGAVLFAHGSGSSRQSPRNRFVAEQLREVGLATLLVDLLTDEEEAADQRRRHLCFDIPFLATRLLDAMTWLARDLETRALPLGLFGASTWAGAALAAAAARPESVAAVVSRGGRPDLAGDALPLVRGATLLIVGAGDEPVIELNRRAMARLQAETALAIVPGATHLFEEPGTLEQVARLARDWFVRHLVRQHAGTPGPVW